MNERRVQGAGLSLAVREHGDPAAPTVVLVHGFPDTQSVWDLVVARLSGRFHVVTYDVRGAGQSDVPVHTHGYRLPLLIDDLAAVIDTTSPGRPVHLVGHDWGSVQSWEAVTSEVLAGRVASYTSISGPPLDHAGEWTRRRMAAGLGAVPALSRQAVRSSYVAAFHLPGVAWLASLTSRSNRSRSLWVRALRLGQGIEADDEWPAPSFGADMANGIHLYLANVRGKMLRPSPRRTDVPVQIVVPTGDRYVSPAFLEGLEHWSPTTFWRTVSAGHWVVRSHAGALAGWVAELVDHVEGTSTEVLEPLRVVDGMVPADRAHGDELVVITGAGSGIGRATALAFAERGAHVVAADIDVVSAARTAELCVVVGAGRAHSYGVDVGDAEAMEAFAKDVVTAHGIPAVVVNNAGIGMAGPFLETTTADWERIVHVNLWGVIHSSRLFARHMVDAARPGHIVNVASAAAFMPSRSLSAYSTTKASVLMLTECLRAELAGSGIGVSAICPGFARTGIIDNTRFVGTEANEQDRIRLRTNALYERRGLSPETVATAIVGAVEHNQAVVPVGVEARLARFVWRWLPAVTRRLARIDAPL